MTTRVSQLETFRDGNRPGARCPVCPADRVVERASCGAWRIGRLPSRTPRSGPNSRGGGTPGAVGTWTSGAAGQDGWGRGYAGVVERSEEVEVAD